MYSILNDFPLNVMYWVKVDDNKYEVLDGQQRIISFCEYLNGNYSIKLNDQAQYFHTLGENIRDKIKNYDRFVIYVCEGTEEEVLEWFKIVNLVGERLTPQEIRNAIYSSPWVTAARKYFSKTNGPAWNQAKDFIKGTPNRQEYLETVINWHLEWLDKKPAIDEYMAEKKKNQTNNAEELILFFNEVVEWINMVFYKLSPNAKRLMKNVDWGYMYNTYHNKNFEAKQVKKLIKNFLEAEDVEKKINCFEYALTQDDKFAQLRLFSEDQKISVLEKQNYLCNKCKKK